MSEPVMSDQVVPQPRHTRGGRPYKGGAPRRKTSLSLSIPLAQLAFNKADELGIPVSDVIVMWASVGAGLPVPDYITHELEVAEGRVNQPLLEAV